MGEDNNTIVFTSAALLDLLTSIDELADIDVGLTQTLDNQFQLQVGSSIYDLQPADESEVAVDIDTVDEIEQINVDAYDAIVDDTDLLDITDKPIEGGPIKEIAKTLLVGGMVRLAGKILK